MRICNKRDFFAGLLLVGFGVVILLIASNYRMGTTFRMGPGFFPVLLSILLIVLGIIETVIALRSGEQLASPKLPWRPLLIVSGSIVLFGLFINSAGLMLMTFALVVVSRLSRPGYPWVETAILGVVVSAACAAVFYFGLKIQIPLLPIWWG
ncbi:MAG: tripartite tricarboxylate transporter TctB family protein [Syntrophales bacterium]|nr:tripartite tricarboxylate transporter TctB family protein [Syntrophales bacterium]